jgi:zinc protease
VTRLPARLAPLAVLLLGPAVALAGAPWARTAPPPPAAAVAVPAPPVTEVTLPTGLRVVVVEHHRRPIVLARLVMPRGALLDPPGMEGASWLGIQLASDFREVGPDGEELAEEKSFRRQVMEEGGQAWFQVGADTTVVGIAGYARDAGRYLDLIAGAVTKPRAGEESFRERRNALLDEIEDVETSDPRALGRVLAEAAFGPGHPYARSVVGTLASLRPMGIEDAVARQQQILSPDGATLLVVGDVSAPAILAAARKAFGTWRHRGATPPRVAAPAAAAARRDIDFLRRQPATTLIVCASRPLGDVQASDGAVDLLATILGEGFEGRLVAVLREQNGLTYSAGVQVVRHRWARALLACSALAADRAEAGIRLFRETLDAAASAPPTDEEVRRAKAIRMAELEGAWDDAPSIAAAWLHALALGKARPRLAEERAELERIAPDEVRALARSVLTPAALRWIVSGEPRTAARAVDGNRLGTLRALTLER